MDIFFSYTDFYTFREKRSWLFFILANFGALLLSNYDVLSLLVRTPELDVYIDVFPSSTRLAILFIKKLLGFVKYYCFYHFIGNLYCLFCH